MEDIQFIAMRSYIFIFPASCGERRSANHNQSQQHRSDLQTYLYNRLCVWPPVRRSCRCNGEHDLPLLLTVLFFSVSFQQAVSRRSSGSSNWERSRGLTISRHTAVYNTLQYAVTRTSKHFKLYNSIKFKLSNNSFALFKDYDSDKNFNVN